MTKARYPEYTDWLDKTYCSDHELLRVCACSRPDEGRDIDYQEN